jgi:hypothetical protein
MGVIMIVYFLIGFISGVAGSFIENQHNLSSTQGVIVTMGLAITGAVIFTLLTGV